MAGADAQAGFYYQNIVAAQYALNLIEFGSQVRAITPENRLRARHIDDIVVDYADGATFVQVKWAQDETSAFTLHNLAAAEDDSTSLLAKLARGYRDIAGLVGRKEIVLFSTRQAGTNRQPGQGFDKSLSEFINDFHQPLVQAEDSVDIRRIATYTEYSAILNRLLTASGLRDLDELTKFLRCLRFRLGMPDRETMADRIRTQLVRLGIEQRYYGVLLDEIVKWSIVSALVKPDDVRTALGIQDRFVDRVSHYFPLDRTVWVQTPDLFHQLDSSIGSLDSGFILLEGEPGSGKSTALTMYLADRPDVRFGYYCFVPNDKTLANDRLGNDCFVRSICIGLRNAFPDIDFPNPYAPQTVQLLNDWLNTLSVAGRRIILVVDGLDHVDQKTRQSLVARPLTTVLDADELPSNVLIVLSSRYPEALPQALIDHVKADRRRHIVMPRFGTVQVRQFLQLRGVALSDHLLETVVTVSGGIPIYLEYLSDQLGELNSYQQERYLQEVPSLRDDRIEAYHEHLWQRCRGDECLVYVLAILAARDEFTTMETLRELLQILGVPSSLHKVHESVSTLWHIMRVSDANSVAIRHSSLTEFVTERTAYLRNEINAAIVTWYDQHPDDDDAWRNRLRHLFERGDYAKVASSCDDDWLVRAWSHHRPICEIQRNLDVAWRALSANRDLLEFVRIGLLKQQVAIVARNLDISDVDVANLLLEMNKLEEALRRVWDGERRQCSAVEFASFCLEHLAKTGRTPAGYIVNTGLGDEPPPGSDLEILKIWYRARGVTGDPVAALEKIGHMQWRSKAHYGHATGPVDENESRRLNLEIQLALVRELQLHGSPSYLELVRSSRELPSPVKVAAQAAIGVRLARAGEDADAISTLNDLDLTCLPESHERMLLLEAAAGGKHGLLRGRTGHPSLPADMLSGEGSDLEDSLFDLYSALRCFFLHDETGFPWFESMLTALAEPAKTLMLAIGRLARLWTDRCLAVGSATSRLSEFYSIATDLDLPSVKFRLMGLRGERAEYKYHQRAHRFYGDVWSCAAYVLPDGELEELGAWWVRIDEGARALRYPEATRALARAVHGRLGDRTRVLMRQLLELAERSERADEEASLIAPGLLICASAWAGCGLPDEAQRLWCELFDLACGVYWRKDYQFNEILTPLLLAHELDPSGTLDRVAEQLVLAYQLVGTAQSKTVEVAIEGLIEFISTVQPALGLRALAREEGQIYRERAVAGFVRALLEDSRVERRLLVALVATMGRWANYTEFDEQTNPVMFAVYSSALASGDLEAAHAAYQLWRHVLLVEKQTPGALGRWAAAWNDVGGAPTSVRQDHNDYPAPAEEATTELSRAAGFEGDQANFEKLNEAAADLGKLEVRLQEQLDAAAHGERRRELDRFREEWQVALGRAAAHKWSDSDAEALDICFQELSERALAVEDDSIAARKDAVRNAVRCSIDSVSAKLSLNVTYDSFLQYYELDQWLDDFCRAGTKPYLLQRKLEQQLPGWISVAPYTQLDSWEAFCRRRADGEARASGLLGIAERRSKVDPDRAVTNVIEAWKCVADFFHEHRRLARRICTLLLDLDSDKGTTLLFESFRQQYQRFPETIIYQIDSLLDFAAYFPAFDRVRLYEIWASHNRRLAAGLSEKPVDVSWLKEPVHSEFQDACIEYLLGLFDYPIVDVRLLAVDELLRLTSERPVLVSSILDTWSDLGDGQKEYVANLLFSIGLREPASANRWASQLVEYGRQERHRNLRVTIAEAVEMAVLGGADLDRSVLADAMALRLAPGIVITRQPLIHGGEQRLSRVPRYLRWSLAVLAAGSFEGELEAETQRILSRLYSNPETGLEEEAAMHRAYNINTNFDVIEISGEYDRAVRASLNRSVQILVDSHEADIGEVMNSEDVLRLRDPSDVLVRRVQRPDEVAWVGHEQCDEDFVAFLDIDVLKIGYATRDDGWVSVFEYTEQRTGGRIGSESHRGAIVRIVTFGVRRGGLPPTNAEIWTATQRGALRRLRNRYRFELARLVLPLEFENVFPIVVATGRAFRGRRTPDLAAVISGVAASLGLSPSSDDPFGWVNGDGDKVVRSIEWQEAFDQDRRRHEPRSVGFLLQFRRDELIRLADQEGLDVWAAATVRRTVDRYKPEHEMNWVERTLLFRLINQDGVQDDSE